MLVLKYVKNMVEVDEIHFLKVKNKGRLSFPVAMGGCAINHENVHENVVKEALEILKVIDLHLYRPWKHDFHMII